MYIAESGGLLQSSLICRMAELANVGCLVGAIPELGIGISAGVHLGVAMTNIEEPCDASGVLYHEVDIIEEAFRIENGRIWPLEGPGLGVTLYWNAIEQVRAG